MGENPFKKGISLAVLYVITRGTKKSSTEEETLKHETAEEVVFDINFSTKQWENDKKRILCVAYREET